MSAVFLVSVSDDINAISKKIEILVYFYARTKTRERKFGMVDRFIFSNWFSKPFQFPNRFMKKVEIPNRFSEPFRLRLLIQTGL
jgi:hypothetical protein